MDYVGKKKGKYQKNSIFANDNINRRLAYIQMSKNIGIYFNLCWIWKNLFWEKLKGQGHVYWVRRIYTLTRSRWWLSRLRSEPPPWSNHPAKFSGDIILWKWRYNFFIKELHDLSVERFSTGLVWYPLVFRTWK